MLFDRRPILQEMTDKLAVRNYVRSRLGSAILPKQYLVTTQPAAIPFNDLPDKFVVKPTHGSGWVRIVRDRSTIDRAALIATCGEWLSQSFYERTREWSYKQIVPRISIEELVENEADASPHEYKLFVFGGRVRMIQVATGRFKALRRRLYTPSWEGIDALLDRGDVPGDDMKRPPHLKDMISAAEALAEDIDFVRADFYDTPDKLYFGELTTTPACGYYRPVPLKLDYVLGDFWKLRGP
jgi:hypothetical protein